MSLFPNLGPQFNKTSSYPAQSKPHSVIHFGSNDTVQVQSNTEPRTQRQPVRASFQDALWLGAKAAFKPESLVFDAALGTIATILFAFMPPHIHALATLPIWIILGAIIRGVQTFQAAYSGHVTPV
jgi:hypothetical protein